MGRVSSKRNVSRKKMRRFSVAFRKIFREILDLFVKMNEAKTKQNLLEMSWVQIKNE